MDYLEIEKGVRDIYDSMAERYTEKARANWEEKTQLLSFLDMLSGKKVLDIGCGTGEVLGFCESRGFNMTGIDISEQMIKIAGKAAPGARLSVMSVYGLSELTESFDGVIAAYILVHIPKDRVDGVLRDIYARLTPGGKLFLAFTRARETNEFMVNYTTEEVAELLRNNDFRVRSSCTDRGDDLETGVIIAEKSGNV